MKRVGVQDPVSLMPSALTRNPKISTNAKAMYCAIRSHAEGDGTNAYPKIDTLAGHLGVSRSTAKRAIAEIERAGWIVVEHRYDAKGNRTSSLYTCLTRAGEVPSLSVTSDPTEGSPVNHNLGTIT